MQLSNIPSCQKVLISNQILSLSPFCFVLTAMEIRTQPADTLLTLSLHRLELRVSSFPGQGL